MVGGAVRVGGVEVFGAELGVVVEERGLVGVDVPDVHPADPPGERRGGEGMVEVAGLASEHVAVLVGLGQSGVDEVDVAGGLEHVHGILLAVGVEVTDDRHVLAGHGTEQRHQSLGLLHAIGVVTTLAVSTCRAWPSGCEARPLANGRRTTSPATALGSDVEHPGPKRCGPGCRAGAASGKGGQPSSSENCPDGSHFGPSQRSAGLAMPTTRGPTARAVLAMRLRFTKYLLACSGVLERRLLMPLAQQTSPLGI
jgi:hypothetical protein